MDKFLENVTDRLWDSFGKAKEASAFGGIHTPSKRAVAEIVQRLLHLMFPGYYDDSPLWSEVENVKKKSIGQQIGKLHELLSNEIQKHLLLDQKEISAEEMTRKFLEDLPIVREQLNTDIQAAFDGDAAAKSYEEIILAYPCIEAIAVQRLAHRLYQLKVNLIPRMMTEWAHSRTGMDIHPGASIGTHFFIDHGTGVVIGETSDIGNHVKLHHGVTLGARSTAHAEQLRGKKRHPTIGNYVTIYPGATILGGDMIIGEHSTIGGNVFLIDQHVPPHHLVISEETTVIMKPKKNL
ncbi:MAG: serine O-acetyltransferase EpsC [Verrucomicrobiota bacterium]